MTKEPDEKLGEKILVTEQEAQEAVKIVWEQAIRDFAAWADAGAAERKIQAAMLTERFS